MTTKTKKRRRKRSISLAVLLAALLPLAASPADKKTAPPAYALVGGGVFQESGYALPNVEITLIPDPEPGSAPAKLKKMQALSDSRGEFVFRVPSGPMRYTVRAAAKGFATQEKPVAVQGEERVEVTFQLPAQSK